MSCFVKEITLRCKILSFLISRFHNEDLKFSCQYYLTYSDGEQSEIKYLSQVTSRGFPLLTKNNAKMIEECFLFSHPNGYRAVITTEQDAETLRKYMVIMAKNNKKELYAQIHELASKYPEFVSCIRQTNNKEISMYLK